MKSGTVVGRIFILGFWGENGWGRSMVKGNGGEIKSRPRREAQRQVSHQGCL